MKKVLFATTALVATASVAAADVTFSGYGRFGILYSSSLDGQPARPAVLPSAPVAGVIAVPAVPAIGATPAVPAVAAVTARPGYVAALTTATGTAAALEAAEAAIAVAPTAAAQTAAVTARDAAAAANTAAQAALAAETPGSLAVPATAGVDSATNVTSRLRLQIDATTESDMGVTFGARIRLQGNESTEAGGTRAQFNGIRYFARSGGLEVGVGNIFGALESMPGMYPIDLGLTGHAYDYTAYGSGTGGDAYSSGGLGAAGSNGVEVLYSMGDFAVHISASDNNDRVAAYAAYTFSGYTFALALQDSTRATDTDWAVTVGGSFGMADVTLAYADNGTRGDTIVLAGGIDVGAATNIEAYVAQSDDWEDTGFGIDFNQDLGGGASLRGGISTGGSYGGELVDLGVRFNF